MVNLWGPGAFGLARPSATRPALTPANGGGDPDDWFKDCTSPEARDGTEWRAGYFNALLANLRSIVRRSGFTATNLDDDLLARSIRSQGLNYFVATGSANALAITPAPAFASVAAIGAAPLLIYTPYGNTGPATLTVNGNTAALKRQDGEPLQRGAYFAGGLFRCWQVGGEFRMFQAIPQVERSLTLFGAAQSLPDAVETEINFAAPVADPLGFFNPAQPSRLTIPAGIGKVRVSGVIAFGISGVGYRQQRILQNGGAIPAGGRLNAGPVQSGNVQPLNITGFPVDVTPGDYFTMLGLQNSGGSLANDEPSTSFSIEY